MRDENELTAGKISLIGIGWNLEVVHPVSIKTGNLARRGVCTSTKYNG
jgi:hypothetical protein